MKPIDVTNEKQRSTIPYLLAKTFTDEIKWMLLCYRLPQRLELCTHFMESTRLLERLFANGPLDTAIWEAYRAKEDALARRFGSEFAAYNNLDVLKYLAPEDVLLQTGLMDVDTFNKLAPEQRSITPAEFADFMQLSREILQLHLRDLYLNLPPEWAPEEPTTHSADAIQEEQEKEITRARQLLLVYYLLKGGFDIDRHNTDVSDVARFVHALLGVRLTTLQNSDIYKKYRQMPGYKNGLPLLEDLHFVRDALEHLKAAKAIELVEAAIVEETDRLGKQ